MKKKIVSTAYRCITDDSGDIELHDLYQDNGKSYNEPCLLFKKVKYDDYWDDHEYVKDFLHALHFRLKTAKTEEFKTYCKDNGFDFKKMKKELRKIYSSAKVLNFWNE